MNSQQAINLLNGLEQRLDDYCELNNEGKAAFRMAITALELFGNAEQLPSAQPVQWIPCSERLPEEDHWLGGSGRQFSDEVMVSVANYDDEDIWIDISQTIDGQWALELPGHCEIIAWIPLPEPYTKRRGK